MGFRQVWGVVVIHFGSGVEALLKARLGSARFGWIAASLD